MEFWGYLQRVYTDFDSNCFFDTASEFNIPNRIIYNSVENTYVISSNNSYTLYSYNSDSAILSVVNLDTPFYVNCNNSSIKINFNGTVKDTSGVNFPIRSTKSGFCPKITSYSNSIIRPGRWTKYNLHYQNDAMDTAYNIYINIEIDTNQTDSIKSFYPFTQSGNILTFQAGNVRPFDYKYISYSVKFDTNSIIGSSICHRANIFPRCNVIDYPNYDSSKIVASLRCIENDSIEVKVENISSKLQTESGLVFSYFNELIEMVDSFKLVGNDKILFRYKIDSNKIYTSKVYSNNGDPINPIIIRHDDLCALKVPFISNNSVLDFLRHDEAWEYEEVCDLIRGSYDPNIKSVQPIGLFSQHYTATDTELKYRVDFQNTGNDTAFKVIIIDTLSPLLDISSFIPGVSSHPYRTEFRGRAVKFVFDPIYLVDSGTNEPASHGYVTFKIEHNRNIAPKSKIKNNADIYFDFNASIRTNTVFNSIFDTVQIYIPKVVDTNTHTDSTNDNDSTNSILNNYKASVLVFPNPSTDKFFIQLSKQASDLDIKIYNMQGRLIDDYNVRNNKLIEVSAERFIKGSYIIHCLENGKLLTTKTIIVK